MSTLSCGNSSVQRRSETDALKHQPNMVSITTAPTYINKTSSSGFFYTLTLD